MGITDGKLIYCHGVAEWNEDKKISTLEYNNRTVYECLDNPFTADCVSPAMHLPPITIDDRPPRIREPDMPQICSQLLFMLPLKTMLVPWSPLLILHISFLLMVLKIYMFWRKICLWKVEYTKDTAVGNKAEKMLQKDKFLLLPMLRWRQEILLLSGVFQDSFRDEDLLLGTSTFCVTRLWLIFVFVSLPSFTLSVALVLCLFPSCPIDHSLYCFCWPFECMWWYPRQIAKLYWQSSCLLQAIKEGLDLMQTEKNSIAY